MTRFVVLAALGLSVFAVLAGKTSGFDAVGTTCLAFLAGFAVLLVGGWLESLRLRFRPPPYIRRQ
jgi:hypothetical protein